MMQLIALLLIVIASILPSIVIGTMGAKMINAIGERPSSASRIFLSRMIIIVVAEAVSIIIFVIVYNLFATYAKNK